MCEIKLIEKDTDIKSLKMSKYNWDTVVYGKPYQVVKIEGYVHTIGGYWKENNLWMYPRYEEPTYENLIEYSVPGNGVCWGYRYEPHLYVRTKWDETECFRTGGVMITRNGADFYFCRGGIDEAKWLLHGIDDHPIDLNFYDFEKNVIGRKVWWRSEPGIITSWVGHGQACVIIEPDGISKFTKPAEYKDDDIYDDCEPTIKADIFDSHICWFRD